MPLQQNTTTSAMIQQLPLPSISRFAASLPPAVAALVATLPTIDLKDEKNLETMEEESPMSPVPSEQESPMSPVLKDYKQEKNSEQLEIFLNSSEKKEDIDLGDIDLRKEVLKDSDDDLEDTDMRFAVPSALVKSAVEELDEDIDLRQPQKNTQPAIIPVDPIQKVTDSKQQITDVQALMNSLRKSGIINGTDLAGILSKVKA